MSAGHAGACTPRESIAPALLQLAHAEFGRVFATRAPYDGVTICHPAPYGAPGGGGRVLRYQAAFTYPGTVLVHHIHGSTLHGLVAASKPGRPDVLAVDPQADPDDPYTAEVCAALLRKACQALEGPCKLCGHSVSLYSDFAQAAPPWEASFEWPGVVRVRTVDGSALLAISLPGQPLQLDTHALRAAANPGDH